MSLHVLQMTALEEMPRTFDAVTVNGARALGLDGYGLGEGCHGDIVILQASDKIEALRLKSARLFVVRRGKVIAETTRVESRLHLDDRGVEVTFTRDAVARAWVLSVAMAPAASVGCGSTRVG